MSRFDPAVWQTPVEPADILFTRGVGPFSGGILWATRSRGEAPTEVSHVGLFDTAGTLATASLLEAVARVRRTTLPESYLKPTGGPAPAVTIARCESLTPFERQKIVYYSRSMENRWYGWGKIPLHLADAAIGKLSRRKRTPVLFRRLAISPWPICSQHVPSAYAMAGIFFGLRDKYAQPDDIRDAIVEGRVAGQWTWPIGLELKELPPPPAESTNA